MKYVFQFLIAVCLMLSTVSPVPAQTASTNDATTPTQTAPANCPTPGKTVFDNRHVEENIQRAIFGYVNQAVSAGCFPCCFCCGEGDCCDECKDNNNLTIRPPSNE
ncbi:hypothetical protein [Roseovarius sp.]|uniref:hypothetical protein n=1 Tax=Roseovarius sp. TaxID=1486281 RepID=UPI003D130D0F